MQVLITAEIHGQHKKLKRILAREQGEFDLAIAIGNLAGQNDFSTLQETFNDHAELTKAIPGPLDREETMKNLVNDRMNLHKQIFSLRGLEFVGIGSIDDLQLDVQEDLTEDEDEQLGEITGALLDRTQSDKRILTSYRNPYQAFGTNDGSKELRKTVSNEDLVAAICGQQLEQQERLVDGTLVLNPGTVIKGEYALLDLEEGVSDLRSL
jgi:Icc-related predicted phosphoesterase